MSDQYTEKCAQCPQILDIDVPIHIMIRASDQYEETICNDCFQNIDYEGWTEDI